jgi:hypothetical protein
VQIICALVQRFGLSRIHATSGHELLALSYGLGQVLLGNINIGGSDVASVAEIVSLVLVHFFEGEHLLARSRALKP